MLKRVQGRRRPRLDLGGSGTRRRIAPTIWTSLVVATVLAPITVLLRLPAAARAGHWHFLSLATALAAGSLVVAAAVLPSRVRLLTSHLGVERLLRHHRLLALTGSGLVLLHVVFVLLHSRRGLGIFDLAEAPPRVWAATSATVALVLLVVSGLTRRRRRPRYEGWRLVHVLLANVVLVGSALHVYWLHDMTRYGAARTWFLVLAVAIGALSVHRWVLRPLRSRRSRYVVEEVRSDTPAIVTVALRAEGHRGVRFRPGQFAWLKIGDSPYVFEEHPFTIASSATTPWRKEFTIKALGDFSELVAGMRPGRTVHLDGPHGAFTCDDVRSGGLVLVAAGVGVTPMLSMVRTLHALGDRRPVVLVVSGRTEDDLVHREESREWRRRLDLTVVEVLAQPPDDWQGHVGRVDRTVLEAALPGRRSRRRRDYFICGPDGMVSAVEDVLAGWEVDPSQVHTELFDVI